MAGQALSTCRSSSELCEPKESETKPDASEEHGIGAAQQAPKSFRATTRQLWRIGNFIEDGRMQLHGATTTYLFTAAGTSPTPARHPRRGWFGALMEAGEPIKMRSVPAKAGGQLVWTVPVARMLDRQATGIDLLPGFRWDVREVSLTHPLESPRCHCIRR